MYGDYLLKVSRNALIFSEGGTRNEMFAAYLEGLAKKMMRKYADKNIIIIMDNLKSHKCYLVKDIVKKYD